MSAERDCGHDSAAYVLGALEPGEIEAFRRHLGSCAVCRDEVETLGHVVDALPMAAPQYEPSRKLRRRVMRAVYAEPKGAPEAHASARRRRPPALGARFLRPGLANAMALGLIAAVAVAAIAIGITRISSGGSAARVVEASVGAAQLRVSGDRGELIVRHLPTPASGRVYEMWLQRGSAKPAPSTLFAPTARGTADVGVPGSLRGVRRLMITSEPSGGSRVPTTPPVIVVSPE